MVIEDVLIMGRRPDRNRVVLVSGFFDPPHRGHVAYLQEAKKLGDWLIVHIHRDECCVRKKGYCFMPLEDRMAVMGAIKYVDEMIVCEPSCDLTVCDVLRNVKPDIFAKGGDRTPENMPKSEVELCERLGIKIVYGVGGGKVQSSSWLVKKLNETKSAREYTEISI
jgi:D-beta-D-heptose 7-phosphate kinase/D-beta-D-heptose 1-phosphate adenosyltransferase